MNTDYKIFAAEHNICQLNKNNIKEENQKLITDKQMPVSNISVLSNKFQFLSNYSEKHTSLADEDLLSNIKKIMFKAINYLEGLFAISNSKESERHDDIYRTQEHLHYGSGSIPGVNYNAFFIALNHCQPSKNIEELKSQINTFREEYQLTQFIQHERKENPKGEEEWVNKTKENLNKLKVGESKWLEVNVKQHGMMMRIEKKDNEIFNLYFANSGGTEILHDFHPGKIKEDGSQIYRLVSTIENIPTKALLEENFLKNLIHAADTGENSEAAKEFYKEKEEKFIIPVYRELMTLINDESKLNSSDDVRHWNRLQTTGSCGSSCIWAMARSILNPKEFLELETFMQVHALIKHYQLLKSNTDKTSIRKIMVLDLIQNLEKNNFLIDKDKEILLKIKNEVKASLKMNEPEMKIANTSKVNIEDFISEKNGKYELSFWPILSNRKFGLMESAFNRFNEVQNNNLKAYLKMIKPHTEKNFQIKKKNNKWIGVGYFDKIALLCFHIANGDQEQTTVSMNNLLDGIKFLDLSELNYKNNKIEGLEEILQCLTCCLRELDYTRSGIAKNLFLSGLALKIQCQKFHLNFNEIQKQIWEMDYFLDNEQFEIFIDKSLSLDNKNEITKEVKDEKYLFMSYCRSFRTAKYFFANLNVKNLLAEDNIWLKGLDAIGASQPKIESKEFNSMKNMDFHLQDLLEQPNPDVIANNIFNEQIKCI